jgi:hypothetical protein
MWAIGLGLLSTLGPDSTLAQQVGYSVLTGVGVGQTFQPSLVAVQGALERKDMAIVTSLRRYGFDPIAIFNSQCFSVLYVISEEVSVLLSQKLLCT